jgi:hypothetical protein
MGRMAEVEPDFFWEEAADGNRNLRHGTPDRNNQEVYYGTSGTMTCYMPEQGMNYKKAICYLNGFMGTAAFDFPMPFTVTPLVTGVSAGVTVTMNALLVTAATVTTGWVTVEGW